jgi:hypothetical protein
MYDDPNLLALLDSLSFSEDEVYRVSDELDSYRSIPGTTISRYMNRIINNIEDKDRSAFLKGMMSGLAIKKADDELSDLDLFGKSVSNAKIHHRVSLYKWNG